MAVDTSSNALSGFLNFSTVVLKVPTITYFPNNLYLDDLMVLRGTADPAFDVELNITNIQTGGVIIDHVSTNSDGRFTYVPENKMSVGIYSIIAHATTASGISSDYMAPIQVINKEYELNFYINILSNYILLLIPVVSLLALFIIILIFGTHKIKKLRLLLNKKLKETENLVSKNFEILDEDAEKEIAIFKKIRAAKVLDKDEQTFLLKFKKDINEAEKFIQKELREIESINDKQ